MMSPKAKTALRRALLKWFRAEAREMPWRETRDPYCIWLSEAMLQQTQVKTVIPYYLRFLEAFPTVEALAAAPLDSVLKLWEGLGYYTRARNLHKAANLVANERNGQFPEHASDWETLPGVGRYTAAAIASITRGETVAVLDGNVKRVLARLYAIRDSIDQADTVSQLWELAEGLLATSSPGDFNQAMMELGARVCTPRKPKCESCPVSRWCAARSTNIEAELPVRDEKRRVPKVFALAGLIAKDGKILLIRRSTKGLMGGMWALPTTEMVSKPPTEADLVTLVRDQNGVDVSVQKELARATHVFTHRHLTLTLWHCSLNAKRVHKRNGQGSAWVTPKEISQFALGKVYHKVLADVCFESVFGV